MFLLGMGTSIFPSSRYPKQTSTITLHFSMGFIICPISTKHCFIIKSFYFNFITSNISSRIYQTILSFYSLANIFNFCWNCNSNFANASLF
uniref:Candidate secreted effector n=1 Tax=Meloidogyne incognita TaxID=6306 RepID=A0A914KSB4_MELIC